MPRSCLPKLNHEKSFLFIPVSVVVIASFSSCTNDSEVNLKVSDDSTNQVEKVQEVEANKEQQIEESNLGSFKGLVGEWSVDAAMAGVKMDLIFGEDGSFKQMMGQINGEGTWEVLDDEFVKIVTQNTKGQTWKITDLTENSVNMCWNPESPNPKTIPMQRVK